MTTIDHCAKCKSDWTAYVRIGDTIEFWSRPLQQHVRGNVIAVENTKYTISHNGAALSVDHDYKNPVTLIARKGLPTSIEEHVSYVREHRIVAPNITPEASEVVRRLLKKGAL